MIYLRRDQSLQETILDLAHEMTHAVSGPQWDPYDPNLTPGLYIKTAIEGTGGEVEAVLNECHVSEELAQRFGTKNARCEGYFRGLTGDEAKAKILRDFYRVGQWREALSEGLNGEEKLFPHLSDQKPTLYSSTGNSPYPISLLREYEELTKVACSNSVRRMGTLRKPASIREATARFIARRCSLSAQNSQ
jgi:hypothetical protein